MHSACPYSPKCPGSVKQDQAKTPPAMMEKLRICSAVRFVERCGDCAMEWTEESVREFIELKVAAKQNNPYYVQNLRAFDTCYQSRGSHYAPPD